ncbi:uncharacterized transposon-derived protein F54H12.3 [Trichonephila clavipes]|uniref:Uncharacterized transposon-derived protein F54H12.3 n=1 Tax=Trichonephila clavipes TaxID=2585209 RepID=A0A8X6SU36_TRICX|nr:uncharacterized transposon-derived protein F54H12.3 [Trichonephila clavipes]
MHQDLAAFYENPEVPNSFGGVEALHRSVKGKYSKKDVKHWLSQKDAYTLHKPVRHKFQRNRVFVSDIDRQFQADLVDMQFLAEFNKGREEERTKRKDGKGERERVGDGKREEKESGRERGARLACRKGLSPEIE